MHITADTSNCVNLPYCLEPEKVMWNNYPRPKNVGGRGVLNFVLNFFAEVGDSPTEEL